MRIYPKPQPKANFSGSAGTGAIAPSKVRPGIPTPTPGNLLYRVTETRGERPIAAPTFVHQGLAATERFSMRTTPHRQLQAMHLTGWEIATRTETICERGFNLLMTDATRGHSDMDLPTVYPIRRMPVKRIATLRAEVESLKELSTRLKSHFDRFLDSHKADQLAEDPLGRRWVDLLTQCQHVRGNYGMPRLGLLQIALDQWIENQPVPLDDMLAISPFPNHVGGFFCAVMAAMSGARDGARLRSRNQLFRVAAAGFLPGHLFGGDITQPVPITCFYPHSPVALAGPIRRDLLRDLVQNMLIAVRLGAGPGNITLESHLTLEEEGVKLTTSTRPAVGAEQLTERLKERHHLITTDAELLGLPCTITPTEISIVIPNAYLFRSPRDLLGYVKD